MADSGAGQAQAMPQSSRKPFLVAVKWPVPPCCALQLGLEGHWHPVKMLSPGGKARGCFSFHFVKAAARGKSDLKELLGKPVLSYGQMTCCNSCSCGTTFQSHRKLTTYTPYDSKYSAGHCVRTHSYTQETGVNTPCQNWLCSTRLESQPQSS